MSDIKVFKQSVFYGTDEPFMDDCCRWVREPDHKKAIESKDKEIERLKEALKNALDGYAKSDMLFKEEVEEINELRKLTK